jgi:methyltransferase (TIGR00027 family)
MSDENAKEQLLSKTAIVAALYRTVAFKDFAGSRFGTDQFAFAFLPFPLNFLCRFKFFRRKIKEKTEELTPGMYAYMIARTAFFDAMFQDALTSKTPQIVLLGGGYDTRALRYASFNQGTKVFDLDRAETTNRKLKCLNKARAERPSGYDLISIDFNRDSLLDRLVTAGYEPTETTLFIWEGVSYYLEAGSIDATLDFVLNQSGPQSRLAFDYAMSLTDDEMDKHFGVRQFLETWEKERKNEPFKFTIAEGELEAFLSERRMRLNRHWNTQDIEESFLPPKGETSLGPVNGLFRFAAVEAKT